MTSDSASPSPRPHNPASHEARLAHLEEAVMFNERLAEQLHTQVSEAFAAVARLTRRMEALDRKVGQVQHQLEADDPGPEKPPHSA